MNYIYSFINSFDKQSDVKKLLSNIKDIIESNNELVIYLENSFGSRMIKFSNNYESKFRQNILAVNSLFMDEIRILRKFYLSVKIIGDNFKDVMHYLQKIDECSVETENEQNKLTITSYKNIISSMLVSSILLYYSSYSNALNEIVSIFTEKKDFLEYDEPPIDESIKELEEYSQYLDRIQSDFDKSVDI